MSIRSLVTTWCPQFLRPALERIESSPHAYRMARGVFWLMVGVAISRGLTLAASILVARMLGRDVFGELGIVRSTVDMFAVFAGFGFGLTATKHVSEYRRRDPERAGRVIALSGLFAMATGAIIAVTLMALAPWLAEHSLNAPHLAGVLRIGAVILLLTAMNGAQLGALSGFEAFKRIATLNLVVGLASFPVLVGGVYFGGLTGAVWALALNVALSWLLHHIALRKEAARNGVPFTFRGCLRELSVIWRFSLPAALSAVTVGPALWLCNSLLVNQPDGYSQMGIFNAANQWRVAILFIPNALGQIVLPMLSSLNAHEDRVAYLRVLRSNAMIAAVTSVAVAAVVALAAPWIMRSYGPGFEQGLWVLVCLAFTTVLAALKNVVGQAIVSLGRMWISCGFNGLWAVTLLVTSFLLIRAGYGAMGLAIANLIAYLLHNLCEILYVYIIVSEKKESEQGSLLPFGATIEWSGRSDEKS